MFRQNSSVARAAVAAPNNRLHSDQNTHSSRNNDPLISTRQRSSGNWDGRLLVGEDTDRVPRTSVTENPSQLYILVAGPSRPVQLGSPTRELMRAREASKPSREERVLEWQRTQLSAHHPSAALAVDRVKRERERECLALAPQRARSEDSPINAMNESNNESDSDTSSDATTRRLTLSERFGRIAQRSANRSARLENMHITRHASTKLHVRMQRLEINSPPVLEYPGLESAPVGSYPEELLAAAPVGSPSWEDVSDRYDYYKKRGYLSGLTLGDYVKWEEWWYKYQQWLKRERAYERWVGSSRSSQTRRSTPVQLRKCGPRSGPGSVSRSGSVTALRRSSQPPMRLGAIKHAVLSRVPKVNRVTKKRVMDKIYSMCVIM